MKDPRIRRNANTRFLSTRLLLGYRIEPALKKRVAFENSFQAQKRAPDKSVLLEGLPGIMRTGGLVPARPGQKRRNRILIEPNQI
jgi:hypothetical protein